MASKSTDRALDYFNENKSMILGSDQATQGVPTVAGTEVASTPVSEMGAGMQQTLASVMKAPEPIDVGRANGVGMSLNDPSNRPQIPVMNTKAVSDVGTAINNVGGGITELLGSAVKTVGLEEDPALKVATPQPIQRPTFGFA